jgi:hypothetical protein
MPLKGIITMTDLVLGNQLVWAGGLLLVPAVAIALFLTLKKKDAPKKTTKRRSRRPTEDDGVKATRLRNSKSQIDEQLAQHSIEDLRAEEEALSIIRKKIIIDHEKGTLSDVEFKTLRSKYRRRQKKVRSAMTSFETVDEDDSEEDLRAEKRVLESVIVKITKDLNDGTIMETAHRKLAAKYIAQLNQIEAKLRSHEQNGA